MMRSMYSGVSGLRNHQVRMDAIGNNIANVNTVGYKGSRVTFQDTLNQTMRGASAPNGRRGGINAVQVGLGMNLASIDILNTQGNRQNTGNTTDLMIDGDGYFIVGDGGRQYYTRAGNFNVERDGRLVSSSNGLIVQGWLADIKGAINSNTPIGGIQIPMGSTIPPIATTNIKFTGNLNSDTNAYCAFGTSGSISLTDANGNAVSLNAKLTPIPDSFNQFTYDLSPTDDSYSINGSAKGTLQMDRYGNITGVSSTNLTVVTKAGAKFALQLPPLGQGLGGFFATNTLNVPIPQPAITFPGWNPPTTPAVFPNTYPPVAMTDQDGNVINVSYTVSNLGNNRYSYSVAAAGGTVTSGMSGSFTWTAADGVTDPTNEFTVLKSAIGGSEIHIAPLRAGIPLPTFRPVEGMPRQLNATPAWGGGAQTIALPAISDSAGTLPAIMASINFAGGPINWTWSVAAGTTGGTVVGTPGGSFTYTAPNTITNATGSDIVIQSSAGYEVRLSPPINNVTAGGNISFFQSPGNYVFPNFATPPDVVSVSKVYDSLGAPHNITIHARKTGLNIWEWEATEETGLPITNGRGTLSFDPMTGYVSKTPAGNMTFSPIGANAVSINSDFVKLTQGYDMQHDDVEPYKWALSNVNTAQDGYPLGTLNGINIDRYGRVIGAFSNGLNQNLAQVAMANFTNPGGLTRSGDTLFEESSNSGNPQIGQAGLGGRGLMTSGALEMSNVDLSQEFTDMITTERGFQANSKIITTSDEMLQDLVNLKR